MYFGPSRYLCLLAVSATRLIAQAPVEYQLSFPNAPHHEAEIRATFSGITQPTLEVVMSRSSPGRYSLHEFAKNAYNVRASDGKGHALKIERPNPYQWNISGHSGSVVFEYTIFGDKVDGTYDAIDATHAHLNMPATIAWARGMERRPIRLHFAAPEGDSKTWSVASQLRAESGDWWSAPNLDMLMDSPVEFGPHQVYEWTQDKHQFRLALHSMADAESAQRFVRMAETITAEAEGVFGAFPRYDTGTYTFLVDYLPYATSDGMEHRDSTVISNSRVLSADTAPMLAESVAHEFFHSWNVERIRPASLEPFDFERVNMSGELWFAEGFTNYYGPLIEARAGIISLSAFAEELSGTLNTVLSSPGRRMFNAIEMSQQAAFADGGISSDPVNRDNTYVSYYPFGEALALGIDLEIRSRFPGKSLDDWMRAMWKAHADVDLPYTESDLQAALAEAVGNPGFAAEMFDRYIKGKEPMDYRALLERAGFALESSSSKIWMNARDFSVSVQGAEILSATMRGSPLYAAGLDRGDRLLRADGKALGTREDLDRFINLHRPGDRTVISVTGRGGPRDVEVVWTASPTVAVETFERAGRKLTPEMHKFRDEWLRSRASVSVPKLD